MFFYSCAKQFNTSAYSLNLVNFQQKRRKICPSVKKILHERPFDFFSYPQITKVFERTAPTYL